MVKLGYDKCNQLTKGFVASTEDNKEQRHKVSGRKQKNKSIRIAAAQEVKGLLLVITGNGKGKSTSDGTITRAAGHGKKCSRSVC